MYELEWSDRALDALADTMVASDLTTQRAIARTVSRLNLRLRADPSRVGESRGGAWRFAYDAPCAIVFHVDAANRRIEVTKFWTH